MRSLPIVLPTPKIPLPGDFDLLPKFELTYDFNEGIIVDLVGIPVKDGGYLWTEVRRKEDRIEGGRLSSLMSHDLSRKIEMVDHVERLVANLLPPRRIQRRYVFVDGF